MLARLKITTRINLALILALLGIALIVAIGFSVLRAQMMEERQKQLQNIVELAVTAARDNMMAAGGPTTEAGRKALFSALQSSHFGSEKQANYIFAYDYNGVVKVLNDRSKIGQNRFENVDSNGYKWVQGFISAAKDPSGGGFVHYMYEKGVGGAVTPKISYIKNIPEVEALAGMGVYLDDMDAAFFDRLFQVVWRDDRLLLVAFAVLVLVSVLIGFSLIRSIRTGLAAAYCAVDAVARGEFSASADQGRRDEIGQLLNRAADMTKVLKSFASEQLEVARQHNQEGQIGRTIDVSKFHGAYRDMAQNLNEMVKSHVEVQRQFVDRMVEYANGKFEGRMPPLRGERRTISDAAERLRGALMQAAAGAEETLKIKIALDNASSCLMMADNEGVIRYQNKASEALMRGSEQNFRNALPGFSANGVLGARFDRFHQTPGRQQNLLANLKGEHRTQIQVSGMHMRLIANPIADETGARLGTVIEWLDRTAEVNAEKEVGGIVEAAAAGDFSKRIAETGKSGFMLQIAQGLNAILGTSEEALSEIGRILKALAQGDLSQDIRAEFKGVFAELKDNSNETIERLRSIISQIRESSKSINTAAREIATGNDDLARRTEEQASSLEETASSLEELASTVRQNAENATQADKLAAEASASAHRGGEVVAKVVTTMNGITKSNRDIADITTLIDGIAFQTNLLALNAAVEAARAGEQGRGFAVVASEVRSLAQRAAGAAKDIKEVIAASVDKVEDGAKLVQHAGAAMEEIVAQVQRVTAIIGEIAAASREQSDGVQQVNQAVTNIDQITQQNAALVEEATAAARSLEEQSDNLVGAVAIFKMAGGPASEARRDAAGGKAGANGRALH